MLLDREGRKEKKKTIKHKIQSVFIVVILFSIVATEYIWCLCNLLASPFNFLTFIVLLLIYINIISRFAASILSFKFVDQVNRMTDIAKAIANSKNLNKRVNQSSRDDELKKLEEALNGMLEQLEKSFEKQRRFVSDASHELRTPIAILQGYLDILEEWGFEDEAILKESVSSMKEETVHMKILIQNLLFLARSDQGNITINFNLIKLDTIIKKLVKDINLISGDRKVIGEIEHALRIEGDSELMVQMLRALVENSIQYTDEDGSITIRLYEENNYARIDVEDNGIGIPKEDIEKVFERFYRVQEARDKNSGGSGLGLSLVKKIVDIHNGKIEIESEQTKGTKIGILLPIENKS